MEPRLNTPAIRAGHSCATDARQAVAEFHAAVHQPDMEWVLFFCSSEYDLDALAAEMRGLFDGVQVVGCTTAGEIGPAGYRSHSLSGFSLGVGDQVVVSALYPDLAHFDVREGHRLTQGLLQQLEHRAPQADASNTFALLLIDGLSIREEPVAHALQHALGDIGLFGGSAGDDQHFVRTHVYHGGAFHAISAVLTLMHSRFAFSLFRAQHFVASDERLVVTEADAPRRIVREINGRPAAEEYARLVGCRADQLDAARFAAAPVVVVLGGTDYVRSIQSANPDGSLTFYCAIEEGVVFRVAHGHDLLHNLKQTFARLEADIGPLQLVIACDCVLRNMEITRNQTKPEVARWLTDHHVVGFSSYGEQFRGVHLNQTCTGIALGAPKACPV